jgi:hypothetical protein
MKKLLALSSLLLFTGFICSGCQQEERTYTDAESLMEFEGISLSVEFGTK